MSYETVPDCDQGSPVDFLSVLLGFVLGIVFTLTAIGLGVGIAWAVNYNITRRLRGDRLPDKSKAALVRPNGIVTDMTGFINNEVCIFFKFSLTNFFIHFLSQLILSKNENLESDDFQKFWEKIEDL